MCRSNTRFYWSLILISAAVGMNGAASAQILPPHPDAAGGGNPVQGLGRSDDPYPARYKDFVQPPDKTSASQEGESAEAQAAESGDAEKSGEKPSAAAGDVEKILGEKPAEGVDGEAPQADKGQPRLPTAAELEKLRESFEKNTLRRGAPHLVPPPPPLAGPQASPTTPERTALALIKIGNFSEAETKLRELVLNEPNNMHAHYLLAVTLVHARKFPEAKSEYAHVVQNSRNPNLIQLAQAGINKLNK